MVLMLMAEICLRALNQIKLETEPTNNTCVPQSQLKAEGHKGSRKVVKLSLGLLDRLSVKSVLCKPSARN